MHRLTSRLVALAGTFATASCSDRPQVTLALTEHIAAASPTALRDHRVVLVTIDGVRWQDVFEGSDPALGGSRIPATEIIPRTSALAAMRGVALGASIPGCATVHTAGGANVSLPGYQEIFTGRRSTCLDNRCASVDGSVLDEAETAAR
jgi:hypothetical protein